MTNRTAYQITAIIPNIGRVNLVVARRMYNTMLPRFEDAMVGGKDQPNAEDWNEFEALRDFVGEYN